MLNKIWTVIKHNQNLIAALVVCACLLTWGISCEPAVRSPFNPTLTITRTQLDIEVQNMANKIAVAYAEIKRQEQIRDALLNAGLAYAQGSGINPVGLALTIAGILGIGVAVDNRKKDAIIVTKEKAIQALTNNVKGDTV